MEEMMIAPNINCTQLINQTSFEVVNTISTDSYFVVGHIIVFGLLILLWFLFGLTKVSRNKICLQSWVHWRFLIVILIAGIVTTFWFYFPIIFLVGG